MGAGAARALTTTYLPVLLERIQHAPGLIGSVMLVNAAAGFAVPLVVGVWSDRLGAGSRRLVFMAGGAALAGGGLLAVALGTGTSYLMLAVAAAAVYIGLNAVTTAHRSVVAEDFADGERPAATSAQELAALIGGMVALGAGGVLIEGAPGLAFAAMAGVVVLSALPTLAVLRRSRATGRPAADSRAAGGLAAGSRAAGGPPAAGSRPREPRAAMGLAAAIRRGGAREVLLAQLLWVAAYAPLPAFFVLYATDALDVDLATAGLLPAGFGIVAGAGMLLGGRAKPESVYRLLLLGVALLGAGLLGAAQAGDVWAAAAPFAAGALGAGLVSALGFPYFARFVPEGEAGRYSGLFFSVRAIATAATLPLAGVAAQLAGTYRAVPYFGALALLAVVPLVYAERVRRGPRAAARPRPARIGAVVPVFASPRFDAVAHAALAHVDELVLVDDGASPDLKRGLAELAAEPRVTVLRLPRNAGKATAVEAGTQLLLDRLDATDAIVVLDSDCQHPPALIPEFLAASRHADVVIGNRGDRHAMPLDRRAANALANGVLSLVTGRRVRDSQNGMRLYRVEALRRVPLAGGRYEDESRHLKALLRDRRHVAWVDMPTVYNGEPSSFRPLADTVRVGRALLGPSRSPAPSLRPMPPLRALLDTAVSWSGSLALSLGAALVVAALLPVLQPLDSALFLAVNGLGDGPEWVYEAFDPHTRNYIAILALTVLVATVVLRDPRYVLGAAVAVLAGAYLSGAALELIKLFVDRARPEEALAAQTQLSHGRSWSHLASFPSGHLIVTTAMAAAAGAALGRLRPLFLAYVGVIAVTRITFGAHFPLDVAVGGLLGYQLGLFSVALVRAARLLPARSLEAAAAPAEPVPLIAAPRSRGA